MHSYLPLQPSHSCDHIVCKYGHIATLVVVIHILDDCRYGDISVAQISNGPRFSYFEVLYFLIFA